MPLGPGPSQGTGTTQIPDPFPGMALMSPKKVEGAEEIGPLWGGREASYTSLMPG